MIDCLARSHPVRTAGAACRCPRVVVKCVVNADSDTDRLM